ncbi:MAG: hypothetical protein Q4C49_04305 [Bacillota bacterium]|nr:hypothetical protein [Bacillota bacterium]
MSENLTSAFIKPIIQAWLQSLDCTHDSSDHNRMFIKSVDEEHQDENGNCRARFGIIQFYDREFKRKQQGRFYGDIMELSIYEVDINIYGEKTSLTGYLQKIGAQPLFYLHFEMHDFEFVLSQLSSFFRFYYQTEEEEVTIKVFPEKIENILICCTAGLTSGYYASLLQSKMDEDMPNNKIQVCGANVSFLPSMIDEYDIVLLAPQIYYMEKELKKIWG